jgi:hypothetical protein
MADKKISALTAASTPLAGTEVLPIVQSGSTVKVAVSDLTAGRAVTVLSEVVTDGTRKLYLRSRSSAVGTGLAVGTEVTSAGNVVTLAGDIDGGGTGGGVNLAYYSGTSGNWNAALNIRNTAGTYSTLNLMQDGGNVTAGGIVTFSSYGAGAATFSAAGVISSVSDETWKIKDGVPVDPDAMLKKLEPGYWYYNKEKKEIFGSDRQLGFYAQNVNAAIGPEAAPEPETFTVKNQEGIDETATKPWGYYDRSVLAITVMSLKNALATIELLTARVSQLENKL